MDLQPRSGRDNNFNLLRILAAGAVLISHAYPISLGPGTPEPLSHILGIGLGTLAVLTFFAISGYFISQSFHNRRNILDFAVARVLRVFPGLLAALMLTVFILGPVFTKFDLPSYFSDRETLLYVPRNLLLWPLQYDLPGVFDGNPYPGAINGSLWTLFYEIACYAMVAVVGLFALRKSSRHFVGFLLAYAVFYVAMLPFMRSDHHYLQTLRNIHLLSLPFVIGMSLFQFRQQIPLRGLNLAVLVTACALSYGKPWFSELFILAWSYGVLYIGFAQYRPLLAYNHLGDYSYGTYIYAFPVEQAVAALYKGCTPLLMIALSLPGTMLLAVLSWHLLEEPALTRKPNVSAWLRRSIKPVSLSSARKFSLRRSKIVR